MHNYILYVQNKKPPLSLLLKADLKVLRISKNAGYTVFLSKLFQCLNTIIVAFFTFIVSQNFLPHK